MFVEILGRNNYFNQAFNKAGGFGLKFLIFLEFFVTKNSKIENFGKIFFP